MRPEGEGPRYAGRYRLERRLGSGGMGVVHLARSASGLRLAVKVVHAEFAVDPEFRARFRQEVAAARRVSGAFTASVVDADPDGGRPWMATLYIPGPTLAERVKREGPLEPAEVRRLAAGLAEALRDIHRAGVVHRDLKPSNVLLAADGPKVIDFGISRPSDSELRTETGKLIGTPPFMAPEQFQRPREVGPAADVFACASLLVYAATGRGPFESDSPYIVAYQVVHDEPDLS
ncbi:serine/threonine-protein kinase, partial [Streptomyces sp. NPDC049577]|uniref:serine/threonine-protein kinase n=1 Tax=Streptomyces sp. NPDC049577 TaxID=3155153 RepID=UPI00342B5B71